MNTTKLFQHKIQSGFLMIVLLSSTYLFSQNTVHMELQSLPSYHASGSSVYIAGSFNGWNPQDEKFKMVKNEKGQYAIDLNLADGEYEYKVTRGGWDNVECKKGGGAIDNRKLSVPAKEPVLLNIDEWADRIPSKPRVSTASANVHVIDTAFLIPQLNRTRRVWIYLPENYERVKYPVLYLQDGQNVFDEATSFSGEWGIDEFLDTTLIRSCIVVAIDHGGDKRLNEYNPYDNARFGKGEGKLYIDFIATILKPYIDKHYNTRKTPANTFIGGSSMGGLISFYALLQYPKVFGGAAVFSPAFWTAPGLTDDIKKLGEKVKGTVYFYAGKKEGESMVPDMLKIMEAFANVSKSKIKTVIRDDGKHNEATWRKEFAEGYSWLMYPGKGKAGK